MRDTTLVFLKDRTGRVVEATILLEMTSEQVTEVYVDWKPLIDARRRRMFDPQRHRLDPDR